MYFWIWKLQLVCAQGIYTWLCTHGLLLMGFMEPFRVLKIETGSAMCKANVLLALFGKYCIKVLYYCSISQK